MTTTIYDRLRTIEASGTDLDDDEVELMTMIDDLRSDLTDAVNDAATLKAQRDAARTDADRLAKMCNTFVQYFSNGAPLAIARTVHEAIDALAAHAAQPASEPMVTDGLIMDFQRSLPGGTLDDATYDAIETALDQADAPCTGADGRWLKLHERVMGIIAVSPSAPAREGGK